MSQEDITSNAVQVAFIAGLGHSGTTYLEMLLCSNEQAIGLGEVGLLLKNLGADKASHPKCSCGKQFSECSFWAGLKELSAQVDSFTQVLHSAKDTFGNKVFVDSSKSFESFVKYYGTRQPNLDVKIIFLIRDYRSWIFSRTRNAKAKERKSGGLIFEAYRWLFLNMRMQHALNGAGYQVMTVLYEDLVFERESRMQAIFNFLGLHGDFKNENMGKGVVHDIYGNRMKDSPASLRTVRYDSRWMRSWKMLLVQPLLLPQELYMRYVYRKLEIR